MPSAFGGLGCNPSYKRCKKIVDELWSNSAKRIFVTISVSRNARFRGVRGEKDFSFVDLFVGGFLGCECRAFILRVEVV